MPAPTKIYFPQVASGGWADWVEVVNVGAEEANITALARDQNGNVVWETTGDDTSNDWYGDIHDIAIDSNQNVYVVGVSKLDAGIPTTTETLPDGTTQGTNDFRNIGYNGPCIPLKVRSYTSQPSLEKHGPPPHRFYFRLYAY